MFKCPKCGFELHERDEKEYNRITRKNKREEKALRAEYMKAFREERTGLDFSEWCEYKNKSEEQE